MSMPWRAILAGLLGASVPATAMFCLSTVAFFPVTETLIFLVVIATSWGLSAGILALLLQSQHVRIFAFVLGLIAFIVGAFTGSQLYDLDYVRFFPQLSSMQLILVYLGSVVGAGLIAQVLAVYLLIGLRRLGRQSRSDNTL